MPRRKSTIFIEGEGVLTLGDGERPVKGGDGVFIPGNMRHGIRNEGEALLKFFYASRRIPSRK